MKVIKQALIAAVVVAITIYTLGIGTLPLGTAGLGAIFTSAAMQYAVMTFVGTMIAGGVGLLTSKGVEATRQNFGTKLAGKGAQVPRQIVYGQCRVGGTVVKIETSGTANNKLHLAIVLAGHEIESLEEVHVNDVTLTTSDATVSGEKVYTTTNSAFTNTDNDNAFASGRLIRYTFHSGTTDASDIHNNNAVDGVANAALSSAFPSTAKFQGMAYVYMEFIYDPEKNARFPNLWFKVKGKKVYDPRSPSAAAAWSDNPALIIRDYLADTTYGMKAATTELNDANSSGGFHAAAVVCDENIAKASSGLTTYAVTVSGGKFYLDGSTNPALTLTEGNSYRFDQSDNTNSNHPLKFSKTSDGTHGGGTQYNTGVIVYGTAGSSGAYVEISIALNEDPLYYYCANHSGMGNSAATSSGQTEKRYLANGFVTAASEPAGVFEGLLTSCSGAISYVNGKFNLFVGGTQTASLTITDEDILGAVQVTTKQGGGDLYNGVKGIYVDETQDYQGYESPTYQDVNYLAEDTPTGESTSYYKKLLEVQLPFTSTHTMAQRLQRITLRRQRQATTVNILTTLEYMKLQPNDWVMLTNSRLSYSAKTFEVQSVNMEFGENDGVVFAATRLLLQEIDTDVYTYQAAEAQQAAGPVISGGSPAVAAPTSLAVTQLTKQEGSNAKISVIVSWTNSTDQRVQNTEVQWKYNAESDSEYKTAGMAGKGETKATFSGSVKVGEIFNVRVRHIASDNIVSDFSSVVNLTIAQPDTITNSPPTSVSASTGKFGRIVVRFTAPAIQSVTKVNVHYSTSSGFTPSSSTLYETVSVGASEIRAVTLGETDGLSYGTTYYFKLNAENNYGTASTYSSQVSANFDYLTVGEFNLSSNTGIEPIQKFTGTLPTSETTEVIYSTSNNILYRWNGSEYVQTVGATAFSELSGTVQGTQIADSAISTAKFASTIEPVTIVSSVPASKSTDLVYNTTNNLLYRWNGSSYVSAVGASAFSELTGTASTAQIADAAITAVKIGSAAVIAGKIANDAVTSATIEALAVTAAKVAASAIETAKIADGAVATGKLADLAGTEAKIAGNAITATKISDGAVETAKLDAGAVTAAKITAGTITGTEIAGTTIVAGNIASGAVTTAKLDANAVTAAKIEAGTITAAEIAGSTITGAKIAATTIEAGNIATNAVTAAKVNAGAITTAKLDAGAVTTAKLDALAVEAGNIAAGAVQTAKLDAGAVTAAKIGAGAITADKIDANAVTAAKIDANAITVAKLVSNSSKEYGGSGSTDFKFEFGTSTQVAGFTGAGILRAGISNGFGVGALANAATSVASMGQQAHNSSEAYGSYWANSLALGGSTHRSQAGLCNNTRAGIFADSASTINYTHLCNGTYAVQTTGDVYVDGDITATGTITPFTGMHDGLMADDVTPTAGDILTDSSVAIKRDISNTLFVMAVSSSANQSSIGIYAGDRASDYVPVAARKERVPSGIHDPDLPERDSTYNSVFTNRKVIVVNALGEGEVNVCGENGNIAVGDLIVTSSTAGKGMKQSDDILRSYTVARAREGITFASASEVKLCACIYLSG
jgi:hypothetical protein